MQYKEKFTLASEFMDAEPIDEVVIWHKMREFSKKREDRDEWLDSHKS